MSVTIKDVALLANVSPSTVSRVIANNPKISDKTKKRVIKAMKELNYHPNIVARSLANKSTNILGLIIPNEAHDLFSNPFFIKAMNGISLYAQEKKYYIMYAFSKNEEDEVEFIKEYTHSKLVEGIILLTVRENDKCIKYLKKKNYPFVVIGRPDDSKGVLWVDNDNFDAMYKVVNKLISKGCDSIAFIGGPKNRRMSKDRLEGYMSALKDNQISVDEKLIFQKENFSKECGYDAMKKILEYKIPSAVVTTDDLLAFGAIEVMNECGKRIPIIGFNNTPLSQYQQPKLSSVDINSEELGRKAAELLINKLENDDMPVNHYIIPTDIIKRESTK